MADEDVVAQEHHAAGHRRVPWIRWTLVAVAAVVAGIASVSVVETAGDVGPGRVSIDGGWSFRPDTAIAIPPLGTVVFHTHRAPLAIDARIDEIDPVAAQRLVDDRGSVGALEAKATHDLRGLLIGWAWRAVLVAAIAGALAGALVWPRRLPAPLVGAVVAGSAVVLLLGITWFDFSRTSLRDPEYHGALQEAPAVLAAIDRNWGGIEAVPGRLRALASNLTELYTAVGAGGTAPGSNDEEVRILHVSDVHSNPIGLELARGLATGFAVDAIVDTGDLTSFGLPVEARIGALLADMPVPYYFVPGNHDTRANRRAIDAFPNVTLVDGEVVDIEGLRVLGVADPAVTADGEDSDATANAKRDAQAPAVGALVDRLRPDVLTVATLRQATDSLGDVPLVIAGNSHVRSDRTRDGTRLLTVGSTGATGIGSLTEARTGRYEAEILRFRAGRLTTIDYVVFSGTGGDYTISRTVVPPTDRRVPTTTTGPPSPPAPPATTTTSSSSGG